MVKLDDGEWTERPDGWKEKWVGYKLPQNSTIGSLGWIAADQDKGLLIEAFSYWDERDGKPDGLVLEIIAKESKHRLNTFIRRQIMVQEWREENGH